MYKGWKVGPAKSCFKTEGGTYKGGLDNFKPFRAQN